MADGDMKIMLAMFRKVTIVALFEESNSWRM